MRRCGRFMKRLAGFMQHQRQVMQKEGGFMHKPALVMKGRRRINLHRLEVLLRRVRMNFGGGVNFEEILQVAALAGDVRGWTPDEVLAEWVLTRRRSYAGLAVNGSEE